MRAGGQAAGATGEQKQEQDAEDVPLSLILAIKKSIGISFSLVS